jgi:hypothetical protein
MGRISEFPATLSPEKQALFSLGYYHQREERFDQGGDSNADQSDGE